MPKSSAVFSPSKQELRFAEINKMNRVESQAEKAPGVVSQKVFRQPASVSSGMAQEPLIAEVPSAPMPMSPPLSHTGEPSVSESFEFSRIPQLS